MGDTRPTFAAQIAETNRPIQGIIANQRKDSKWEIAWETVLGEKGRTGIYESLEAWFRQV